jgi:hypothetical protein
MKELIGKKILGLRINENQDVLVFDTDQGVVGYEAYGDCCSESWFADITGVSAMFGGTVQTVEEVSMEGYNVEDGRTRQEYDLAYGYKLTTEKGYADIVFRNSSNGYYGGSIDPLRREPPESMTAIVDDWHA